MAVPGACQTLYSGVGAVGKGSGACLLVGVIDIAHAGDLVWALVGGAASVRQEVFLAFWEHSWNTWNQKT